MDDTATVEMVRSEASAEVLAAVVRFFFREADLLDRWQLHEWLDYFDPSAHYSVPTTDLPGGDPDRDLFLVHDDRFMLEQRVNSLLTRSAHAEYPHSRTRRIIGNVQAWVASDGNVEATANFAVHRIRNGSMDTYVGQYRHRLIPDEERGYRFAARTAVLDLDALRPHGKVSIIL